MREETETAYHKAINDVVEYINQNLYKNITIRCLSQIANLSEFHFHRIFKTIIGEPVGAYIIRLRLTGIASNLQLTTKSLSQIAEQTTYQSKHALSKEFKKYFGLTPSVFREHKKDFALQYKNAEKPTPEIKNIESKTVVYIRIIGEYGEKNAYRKAWKKLYNFCKAQNLLSNNTEGLGISFDDSEITPKRCRFYACFTVDKAVQPSGEFGVKCINGGLYAIFTLKGSYSGLQELYNLIFYSWLPNSNYRLRKGVMYEKYINNPDKTDEGDLLTKIYLPVSDKHNKLTTNNVYQYINK